jgi:hypothetical protein
METGTIITITFAWLVIMSFTGYYFVKVLKTPQEKKK